MSARLTKEPIRKPWIWIVLAVIMLAAIPWYLPQATIGLVLLGVPYWMLISVAVTLVMCGYVSWLCFTQWDVVEAEEERDRNGTAHPGSEE
jgi:type VI protein secretion system component VasK